MKRILAVLFLTALLETAAPAQQALVAVVVAGSGQRGYSGDGGPATAAALDRPHGVAVAENGDVLIADSDNGMIRRVDSSGTIRTVAGCKGCSLSDFSVLQGGEGQATGIPFGGIGAIAAGPDGSFYFSSLVGMLGIWRVSPSGRASMLAGMGTDLGEGVPAASAMLRGVAALAMDRVGNLYVCVPITDPSGIPDFNMAGRVRKIGRDGTVTTVAGGGSDPADGIPATRAFVKNPAALAVDSDGNLYIVEYDPMGYMTKGGRVRKVNPAGEISTVAGFGNNFEGENIPATSAKLVMPVSIAVDGSGNLYIGDQAGARLRKVNKAGLISTLQVEAFVIPQGLALDRDGNLLVADPEGNRVWRVTLAQQGAGKPRVASGGVVNAASFQAAVAPGSLITVFGSDLAGTTASASSTPLPQTLGGGSITVNGRAIPLVYASPTQINAQMPYEIAPGPATLIVSARGVAGDPVPITVGRSAPGLFQWGDKRAVVQNRDSSLNTPQKPAAVGSVIVAYLTGQGALDNAVATGAAAPANPLSQAALPVVATLGGKPADVLFAGLTPGFVGLTQVNLKVPELGAGDHPLVVTIGGVASTPALVAVSGN